MLLKYRILMSLVIMILLSSFFFISDYHKKIQQAEISHKQLSRLDSIEIFTDANERLDELLTGGNHNAWQHLAGLYAKENADVAYQLGEYYLQRNEGKTATLWFQNAIRQHHKPARVALAKYYITTKQYFDAQRLLLPIVENEEALVLLYKLALRLGNRVFISQYQTQLAAQSNNDFYQELVGFDVFELDATQTNKLCGIDVQLFATSLTGLKHAKTLMMQFQQHQLSAYICLNNPKYISINQLNCVDNPVEKIACQANVWASRVDISSRYIGLVVEQGGANVDNGIMYIDQEDNVDVLVHELSHFLGFVDEYPLPENHQKCEKIQPIAFSHNVAILKRDYDGEKLEIRKRILAQLPWAALIKKSTPILTKFGQGWRLSTPNKYQDEVGVFFTNTCNKRSDTQAFKPYFNRTKLEYFELAFPTTYLDILALAPKRYLMPSFHFNVSRDLAQDGEYTRAKEILRATLFH
jgi:hypothetical protein